LESFDIADIAVSSFSFVSSRYGSCKPISSVTIFFLHCISDQKVREFPVQAHHGTQPPVRFAVRTVLWTTWYCGEL